MICPLYSLLIIIDSQYIAVQYNMILHTAQQLRIWNFGQYLNSLKTPISRPNGRALCVFRELVVERWPRDIGNALYRVVAIKIPADGNDPIYVNIVIYHLRETYYLNTMTPSLYREPFMRAGPTNDASPWLVIWMATLFRWVAIDSYWGNLRAEADDMPLWKSPTFYLSLTSHEMWHIEVVTISKGNR